VNNGWQKTTIGDVCKVVNGGTPKTKVAEYWDGPHRWITPAEMGKRLDPYVAETARTLTNSGLDNCSAKLLPPYSVILSSRAPIGHLVINTEPMGTNQGCKGLVPSERVDPKFLYYYLSANVDLLNALGTGATFKELSGGKLKRVPIPVPPLAEQQRIVGLLDEAFDGLATARAHAEQNLTNARALFESHLNAVFAEGGEGWEEKQLVEVCDKVTVGHVGSMKQQYREDGIPFLRSQNIRPFEISLDNAVFIDQAFHDSLTKSRLRPGDLAIVRTGYPGTAAVIPPELPDSNCSDLVIVRPGSKVSPHYLAAFFNSGFGKRLVGGNLVGAAQKHFNVTAAKKVGIQIPPLTVQHSITEMVVAFREETQRLEALYRQKLDALDELKQSLLHQAFSGQL
jgi:type I restriction enzyme S subunit